MSGRRRVEVVYDSGTITNPTNLASAVLDVAQYDALLVTGVSGTAAATNVTLNQVREDATTAALKVVASLATTGPDFSMSIGMGVGSPGQGLPVPRRVSFTGTTGASGTLRITVLGIVYDE